LSLDWPNLVAGGVLGIPLGYLAAYAAHARYDRKQAAGRAASLHRRYGTLAGAYSNYRPDGTATGGSIELTQNPDGSFAVVGLNSDRTIDWESVLWMDEKFENEGTAHYRYSSGNNYGVQIVQYMPENGELHVKGVRESAGPPLAFHHTWRPRK
jgi:hypothetical protein